MSDAIAYVDAEGHYLGHFDTENAPAASRAVKTPPEQGVGAVWDGAAWSYPPTAAETLARKLAAGIAITSSGTPALSATYALDATTLDQVGSVARDAAAGLGLPGGGASFIYPDLSGEPRTFTAADIQHLYKAMRDLVFALNTQAAVAEQGGPPSWPAQQATLP